MFCVITCSCGKSLRAYEGMTEVYCPACRQLVQIPQKHELIISATQGVSQTARGPKVPTSPHGTSTDITIFGFDPPPSQVQSVPLHYQVVEISNEISPPLHEDDGRPYPLESVDWRDPVVKSLEEMWGPEVDLTHWPTRRKERSRQRASERTLERSWFDYLAYPLQAWPLLAIFALAMTIATFGLLYALREGGPVTWIFYLFAGVAFAYFCGLLTCVLHGGVRGVIRNLDWPWPKAKMLVESFLAAMFSFLAGPIILAALSIYFWIHAGELTLIDKLILLDLTMKTVGYWFLVFFSCALKRQWRSLLPGAVIERVCELGIGRSSVAVGFVLGIFFVHARLGIAGLADDLSFMSFLLLLVCWTSLLYWLLFLMRWLGLCLYRCRKAGGEKRTETI